MTSGKLQSHSVTPEINVPARLRAEDVNEILAWIDYCVAKGFSKRLKTSIVEYLGNTRQKDFTWTQIEERIKSLFKFNYMLHESGQWDHSIVYRVGTKALRNLDFLKDEAR